MVSGATARARSMEASRVPPRPSRLDPARLREICHELGQFVPVSHAGDWIVLALVQPRLAFVSWHLDPDTLAVLQHRLGSRLEGAVCRVRVHDVTDLLFTGDNAHATFEVAAGAVTGHAYHAVPVTERNLLAEVGFALADGTFVSVRRSTDRWFDRDRPSLRREIGGLFVSGDSRLVLPVESVFDAPVFERLGAVLPALEAARSLRVAVIDVGLGAAVTGMVRRVGHELGKLHAEVTVFAKDAPTGSDGEVVEVALQRARGLYAAFAAEHERRGFDLVHAQEWYSVPAALRAQELGLPLLLSLHSTEHERADGDVGSPLSRAICGWEQRGIAAASAVLVPSSATRLRVITEYGADPSRVLTIPDLAVAADAGEVQPGGGAPSLGFAVDARIVLFAGELSAANGPDLLLEAASDIAREQPAAGFVFAGDGPLRASLAGRSQELGIGDRCRFLGDVTAEHFEPLLRASEMVVIPARQGQGEGLARLALAAGKAVLTTRQAALACIVHGENGLVTFDNPGSIAWGVKELLGRPLAASTRRWEPQRRVLAPPTLDRVMVEHFLAYEAVAGLRLPAEVPVG